MPTGPRNPNLANLLKRGFGQFSFCHWCFGLWPDSPTLRWVYRSCLVPHRILGRVNRILGRVFLVICAWAFFIFPFEDAPLEGATGSKLAVSFFAKYQAQIWHPSPHIPPMYAGLSSAHVAPGCPGMLATLSISARLEKKTHLVQRGTGRPADDLPADASDVLLAFPSRFRNLVRRAMEGEGW